MRENPGVGSGQTGWQISKELREMGSEVFLACGRAPWLPRRMVGQDIVPGLHFCGVHFLCTRKSSLLFGVGQDARIVARSIGGR